MDSRRLVLAQRGCRSGTTGTFPPPPPDKPSQAVMYRGLTFPPRSTKNPSPSDCIATADVHKSAVFIEIGACPIAATELYPHPVEAVQGRTAWARRIATLRRRRISSRRRGIAPSARGDAALPARGPALSERFGIGALPRDRAAAALRGRRVRGLSQVRFARARLSAGQVRRLPGREAGGILVQAPRFLPELRRAADGRDGGVARGQRLAAAARSPVGAVAAVRAALPAGDTARGRHAGARYRLPGDFRPSDSQSRPDPCERGDRRRDPDTALRQCAQSQCAFPPARARRRLSPGR